MAELHQMSCPIVPIGNERGSWKAREGAIIDVRMDPTNVYFSGDDTPSFGYHAVDQSVSIGSNGPLDFKPWFRSSTNPVGGHPGIESQD